MEFRLIRSRRRTLALEYKNGEVIVRAPMRTSQRDIGAFVEKHRDWLKKQEEKYLSRQQTLLSEGFLSEEEIRSLYEQARTYLPGRVAYYADRMGVQYNRVTIRCQKTRWGSCSTKQNLNFNCLLMLTPPGVIDAVVVHELCHLREMNHSDRFYREIERVYPDYRVWDGWLKENGPTLIARLPEK